LASQYIGVIGHFDLSKAANLFIFKNENNDLPTLRYSHGLPRR
jgi:hypothetical protein